MNIREYLKEHKIIGDGAFGTYFMTMNKELDMPEKANLEAPEQVKQIHREYLEAGANLIRTNTFAITPELMGKPKEELSTYFTEGVRLAKEAVSEYIENSHQLEKEVFIAGDIGPITMSNNAKLQDVQDYYYREASLLLEAGVDLLLFESFPELDVIEPVIKKLYQQYQSFIMVQFCLNQYGYGTTGGSAAQLFLQAGQMQEIAAIGLNCGIGPVHMYNILKKIDFPEGKYITALPNAGYPKLSRDRMVYHQNAEYYGDRLKEIADLGIDIVGGCCGTSPVFIEDLAGKIETDRNKIQKKNALEKMKAAGLRIQEAASSEAVPASENTNAFYDEKFKKKPHQKLIAAELAPPFDVKIQKIVDAAALLKNQNVDIVTFPDSPSGRTRIDSIAMAIKVLQETGIKVMPHICCRDKNTIAMTAQIMGAYINDIRNFLVITGDPVPVASRAVIKSVFSYNSVGMMQILKEMNSNSFAEDKIAYGGAVNCGAVNFEVELKKVRKKKEAGATFFFTQPVFNQIEIENLKRLKEETEVTVLCGLMPLISKKNAEFIRNEITGINVTEEILQQFDIDMSREEAENVGVSICKAIVKKTWDFADGYYFSIPFFRTYLIERIMEKFQ